MRKTTLIEIVLIASFLVVWLLRTIGIIEYGNDSPTMSELISQRIAEGHLIPLVIIGCMIFIIVVLVLKNMECRNETR